MKIRIKGNSVRLRLGQSEVAYLGKHGTLEETTKFADAVFVYRLTHASAEDKIKATFVNGEMTVLLPTESFEKLVKTQAVGCEGEMTINDKEVLYILVEKDFKCLDNTFEDQSDNYPNPLAEEYEK